MKFDEFYLNRYLKMKRFAQEYVNSEEDAEDIVQDVFLELYTIYDTLISTYHVDIVSYTFVSVRNRCIDYLRRKMIERKSKERILEKEILILRMKFDSLEALEDNLFKERDIETILNEALQSLPEKCREILIKHKIEGKKQKDIAKELNISHKTVENQLSIAFKKLKETLGKYPGLFMFFMV